LISTVADGVLAEVTVWQSRPLEEVYPVMFFDALRVKIREGEQDRRRRRRRPAHLWCVIRIPGKIGSLLR
jgi:hypothetical protein